MLRITDGMECGKRRDFWPNLLAFLRRLPALATICLCIGCGDSDTEEGVQDTQLAIPQTSQDAGGGEVMSPQQQTPTGQPRAKVARDDHTQTKELSFEEARELFAEYESKAEQIEFDSEYASEVIRYATGRMWSPEPFYEQVDFEEGDVPFRSWLPDAEADSLSALEKDYLCEHGYDLKGRLRYATSFDDGFFCYVYGERYVDVVQLYHSEVWRVVRYVYEGKLVRYRYEIASKSLQEQKYEFRNGNYTKCFARRWSEYQEAEKGQDRVAWQKLTFSPCFDYEIDGHGQVNRVYGYPTDELGVSRIDNRRLIFVRHNHKSPDVVLKQIQDHLVKAIQQAIRNRDGGERLCCIRVPYDSSQPASLWPPPSIYVATESEQAAFRKKNPDTLVEFWDQDLSVVDLPSPPAELEEAILISKRWIEPADENADRNDAQFATRDTAQLLNAIDWARVTDVAGNFVVYAWDESFEHKSLENLVKSIPADRLKQLQATGLVP